MNKNAREVLKQKIKEHLGCSRWETVDFVFGELLKSNTKVDKDNEAVVLSQARKIYQELLKKVQLK